VAVFAAATALRKISVAEFATAARNVRTSPFNVIVFPTAGLPVNVTVTVILVDADALRQPSKAKSVMIFFMVFQSR
jgi:hypothetical protein